MYGQKYSKEENERIRKFCKENNISNPSAFEFFFELNGKAYRVSPFDHPKLTGFDTTALPWVNATKCNIIFIKARKGQIIDIYNALKEGRDLRSLKRKKEEQPVPTPVAKPEEKAINRTVSKKQSALDSLLNKRR